MQKRHKGSFYRRSGAATEDSHGRSVKAWASIATGIEVDLQTISGRVVPGPDGQTIQLVARLFVHPASLPAGVTIAPGDGFVLTSGRFSQSTLIVHEVGPQGSRAEAWDDELVMASTPELIT